MNFPGFEEMLTDGSLTLLNGKINLVQNLDWEIRMMNVRNMEKYVEYLSLEDWVTEREVKK